jgi:hypothetical protein
MSWLPIARPEVEKAACPFDRAWCPRTVVPSRKEIVPVGTPVAGATGDTVAVNVIDWPLTEGFEDELIARDTPLRTICVRAADLVGVKLVSPE